MDTQLFGTVPALQIIIRTFRKPFRMQVKGDLPADKQRHRQRQQAPGITSSHKKQRSEHHGIVPVINSAGTAAFVFHEPCLKRTEEEYADNIADRISTAKQDHDPIIQYPFHIQSAKDTIENDPDQCDQNR